MTRRLEDAAALDPAVEALEPHIRSLFGSGTRGAVLRGDWLGHALYPALTDVVLGTWLSASILDVTGRGQWSEAGPRDKRVGLVHAVTNASAVGAYAASWFARRSGHDECGARLALVGAGISGVGAYLGGHLATARRVGTRDDADIGAPGVG